jgi:hypothetical protein
MKKKPRLEVDLVKVITEDELERLNRKEVAAHLGRETSCRIWEMRGPCRPSDSYEPVSTVVHQCVASSRLYDSQHWHSAAFAGVKHGRMSWVKQVPIRLDASTPRCLTERPRRRETNLDHTSTTLRSSSLAQEGVARTAECLWRHLNPPSYMPRRCRSGWRVRWRLDCERRRICCLPCGS